MPSSSVRFLALAVPLTLAGCGATMSVPEGLAYGPPDPDPATYIFTDTAAFAIETAMGAMEVVTTQDGVAELDFRGWADARVIVRFPRFRGSFHNPAQGTSTVDERDIGGPFTVRIDHTGMVAVTDTPSLSQELLDITGPESLIRPLFAQLPGRTVAVGARWVDTVTIIEESAGTRSVARSVITSTLAGDTVVAGRRLLRIRTESANTIEVTGVSGGVDVEQRLSGATRGTVLWDEGAHLLVERVAAGEMAGTLTLPGLGVAPMAVRATLRRTVSLREQREGDG
jgi:hypothetical protein